MQGLELQTLILEGVTDTRHWTLNSDTDTEILTLTLTLRY